MNTTIIFTDGSSRGNPGLGGYGAVISDGVTVTEIGGRERNTTNNRMEMMAAIAALQKVPHTTQGVVEIFTDSAYLLNGITKWVKGWQANDWQTKAKEDVLNKDLWIELVDVCGAKSIHWTRISGHSGVPANERCDVIATSFADGVPTKLFHGPVADYNINLSVTFGTEKAIASKASSKAKAYSYVSMVKGRVEIHTTWAECEARVNGTSGARFKKSVSPEDEAAIIAEFSK